MAMFNSSHWRQHVALDVGTATTRIASGASHVIEQSSRSGSRHALRAGVVVDGEAAVEILKPLLARTRVFGVVRPCVLACAPTDAHSEERQLLMDSIMQAGAAAVSVIPEPLAAAIGAGLDISSPYARMVVDIGEGVTDCAVMQSGKVQATCAIRIGCERMRREIVAAAKMLGSVALSDAEADGYLRTCGLNRPAGHVGSTLVAVALQPVLESIATEIDLFLRDLPHVLGCEIIETGICLTGGGSLIPGVRECLEQRTGITVTPARNPRVAVVEGARAILPVMVMLNRWR